jgi:uncharacterized protein (TIGR03492 family)
VKTILIISNGLGEDSIGVQVAKALKPHANILAMPMVGQGLAYQAHHIKLYCPSRLPPHAGNRNYQNTLIDDIKAGALSSLLQQRRALKKIKDMQVLVIGDTFPLVIAYLAGLKNILFLDVYKSHHISTYAKPELWFLKRTTQTVYTRDHVLKETLIKNNINAACYGNILLDGLTEHADDDLEIIQNSILLLPGSRADKVYSNLSMILDAITNSINPNPANIYIAKAPGLDFKSIYRQFSFRITETQGLIKQALLASSFVISAAGTSQQQAISMGIPVIGVMTDDVRPARKILIQKLNGPLFFEANDSKSITAQINHLTQNPPTSELIERGKQHLGEPGALKVITGDIIKTLQTKQHST